MIHHVRDLSSDQRLAFESLLGRMLGENESVTIRPEVVLKEAPTGDDRARLFRRYLDHLNVLAERVNDVPEKEIEEAIEVAIKGVRERSR